MKRNQILKRLETWKDAHDSLDKQWEKMAGAFGVSMVETPLWKTAWGMFETYTATLGDMIGDPGGAWLDWFCYENDMGRKGHDAGYDGKTSPIETLGDLADLILDGRDGK